MRQPGEQPPSNPETHKDLGSLVRELHYSMFSVLIEYASPMVQWPAADGLSKYYAVNVPKLEDFDSTLSISEAYRAVGQNWEIVRIYDNATTGKYDVTSFALAPNEDGYGVDVLKSVGMPKTSSEAELTSFWRINERNNRERQRILGMAAPTPEDYLTLESALMDLVAFNEVYFPDRLAFDLTERKAQQGPGHE